MADIEKPRSNFSEDPEKVVGLSQRTTFGDGEVQEIRFKHADPNDGDEALKAFVGHDGESFVMTPEMEKKLLRKIDWHIMPVRPLQSDRKSC